MEPNQAEVPADKEQGVDLAFRVNEAAKFLGVDTQPLMVSQAKQFIRGNEKLFFDVAQAIKSENPSKLASAKKEFETSVTDQGLKIKSAPALEENNLGWLEKNEKGEWELYLDPSLSRMTHQEDYLRNGMHEFGAWWLMKQFQMKEKEEIPSAVTRHGWRPDLKDEDGQPLEIALTHLIDASLLAAAGKLH